MTEDEGLKHGGRKTSVTENTETDDLLADEYKTPQRVYSRVDRSKRVLGFPLNM